MKKLIIIISVCALLGLFLIDKPQIKEKSNKPFVPSAPSSHTN